jgi:hypothetical protein
MLNASVQRGCANQTPPTRSHKHPKEPAMQIGEEQQEFEILPEEEQPLVLPECEPQPQPEAVPA